ncbi:hypothetical protein [Devosia ginsengisoli]|uniref:Uncharacterized protein n=1 Tax=Devosia ginsengisoli TaxID=400770 RepID=A0A5B8LVF0_9HYPH|nr:hypothetical protein [Devosia ginsengisoli]QDZ11575.1 hypothetical protein FPZ08_12880 [Devosia ginsengisoli]
MNLPDWTKPALYGAGVGAIALAVFGFAWGGWVTGGSARDLAAKQSAADVVSALTPYCVQRSLDDPNAAAVLVEFNAANASSRRAILEKAGWATPLGSEVPNRGLAQSCQLALQAGT